MYETLKMEIKIGKYYVNKTWRFLLPCLKTFGEEFVEKYNKVFKLAAGIHDTLLDGSIYEGDSVLYVLFDKKYNEKGFKDFLVWLKYQSYYISDYLYGPDLDTRYHMIMFRLHESYDISYQNFLLGKYSCMYSSEQIENLFNPETKYTEIAVLKKECSAIPYFIDKINTEFNLKLTPKDYKEGELELPLKIEEEVFNSTKYSKVFFDSEDRSWLKTKSM